MSITQSLTRPLTSAITSPLTAPGIGGGGLPNTMVVELASGYLYARFPWDATDDAVQVMKVTADTPSMATTGTVQPWGIRKIPKATSRTGIIAAYNASVLYLADQSDDSAPMRYNNTFVGGNHGPAVAVKITCAAGHGKTVADIGSQWQDSSGNQCWIIEIINSTELTFMRANIGANAEQWFYFATLDAGTMTHVAGATNTTSFAASAAPNWPATREVRSCLKDLSRVIKINGTTTISADGVYDCQFVVVEESYGIINPNSLLDYLVAGRPWASTPSFTAPAVATQVLVAYDHEIHSNGSYSINGRVEFVQKVSMFDGTGYVGFVQAQPITWASGVGSLSMYIRGQGPIVGGIKTWQFQNVEVISGAFEDLDFVKATWVDANNPPDRMVQFARDGSANKLQGFAVGYSRLPGTGAGTSLKDWQGVSSGWCSSARKMYPRCLTRDADALGLGPYDPIPAGAVVQATAYRVFYDLAALPEATTAAVRLYDGGAEVILDFHQNVSNYAIPVPAHLNGKAVTIVTSNGNLTLDASSVSAGTIPITVTGSYGAAVLQVA